MTKSLILRKRASALVVILMFLVLITIMVLAISAGVRLERASAATHLDKVRADFFCMMALDDAVARLRIATADPEVVWISHPGGLMVSETGNFKLTNAVALHSGEPVSGSPSLNMPTLGDPSSFLIVNPDAPGGTPPSMQVAWHFVTNATGGTNGRYAFWTDDESCKVNYNLAWTRFPANTNSLASPTRINLAALPGFNESAANELHAAVTKDNYQTTKFFNSPYDVRRLTNSGIAGLVQSNKFNLTHFNHAPDTTFFNEPRIVLTTQKARANGQPFLDILKTDNTDPGGVPIDTLDEAKLNATINKLKGYLERNDWPMTSGERSLQDKYYGGQSLRLTQLAINVIDYVRSKESAKPFVFPLRGKYNAGGTFKIQGSGSSDAFFGVARTPLINEIGVFMNSDRTEIKVKVEFYLPENYGIPSLDFGNNNFKLFVELSTLHGSPLPYNPSGTGFITITPAECSSEALSAGGFMTVTRTILLGAPPSARPSELCIRVLLQTGAGLAAHGLGDLDAAPLLYPSQLACPIDAETVDIADIRSIEVNDPRVNKHHNDWKVSSRNTFGLRNSIYMTASSSIQPQQDTVAGGEAVSEASLYSPAPKGSAANPSGLVSSPGELGFIHTGVEGDVKAGVPWRTLRLQPNNSPGQSEVPDWAFVDLFTVPVEAMPSAQPLFQPFAGAHGGRVNVNAKIAPFGIERVWPLVALLQGARNHSADPTSILSATDAAKIAGNLSAQTLALSGKSYGMVNFYDSPGEIVEIAGIADGGEESEELVRQLLNMVTIRSNVFSIYALGQSLHPVSGEVMGEQRTHFIVERFFDSDGTHFRTIYARPLSL